MEVTAISPSCLNHHDTCALRCQHSGHRECSFWFFSSSHNQARPLSRTHTNHADHVHELYLSRPASAPMVSAGPRPVSPRSSPLFRVRGRWSHRGAGCFFPPPQLFCCLPPVPGVSLYRLNACENPTERYRRPEHRNALITLNSRGIRKTVLLPYALRFRLQLKSPSKVLWWLH